MRALVVDDDPQLVQLIGLALSRDGWDVTAATSFHEASEAQGPFAVVVADIRLPNGDGRHLKNLYLQTPFVVISGDPRHHPDLAKPFTMAQLRDVIAKVTGP